MNTSGSQKYGIFMQSKLVGTCRADSLNQAKLIARDMKVEFDDVGTIIDSDQITASTINTDGVTVSGPK
ncbi:hypothetical protein [Alteromonas antoniana]|uniref:hypothetical protein n=1 Tax=Alteromonas antoniana TaxID=2803813 RepID=UPI001C480F35|nr:hypothetical protein [Alteromonas antoniana]